MSTRLTLELPTETFESIQREAKKCGRTPEEIGAEWLTERGRRVNGDALLALAGAFESPVTDAGLHHDDYIGASLLSDFGRGGDRESDG